MIQRTLLFLLIFTTCGFAQNDSTLLDSVSLMQAKAYTDLDSALKNPDKVYKLILRKKKYKTFPKEIARFKNLQYLDISKNNIEEIPSEAVNLDKMQYFYCSRCKLKSLPNFINKWNHLKYINVNQNEIENIPESFCELEELQVADLWDNNLSGFPECMAKLKSLRLMDLRGILINQEKQNYIQARLPYTKIYFSPPCKCSW